LLLISTLKEGNLKKKEAKMNLIFFSDITKKKIIPNFMVRFFNVYKYIYNRGNANRGVSPHLKI